MAKRLCALALAAMTLLVTTGAHAANGSLVDLTIATDSPQISGLNYGAQQLRVRNNGFAPATGTISLTYVAPFYIRIDRSVSLPLGCGVRFADPDPDLPEVVTCHLDEDLASGEERLLDLPLVTTEHARFVGAARGMAMVMPASTQPDTDLTDNWTLATVNVIRPTPDFPRNTNPIDLWLTHDEPAVTKHGTVGITFTVGNRGRDMTDRARLIFVTPFHVSVSPNWPGFPFWCSMQLDDPNPRVPQILSCELKRLSRGMSRSLPIAVKLEPGAPRGHLYGMALIAPASSDDADTDQISNLDNPGINNITASE